MVTKDLSTLKIHKFKTKEMYENINTQGLISEDDICLVLEENSPSTQNAVDSVNGKTGDVVLNAADVGAVSNQDVKVGNNDWEQGDNAQGPDGKFLQAADLSLKNGVYDGSPYYSVHGTEFKAGPDFIYRDEMTYSAGGSFEGGSAQFKAGDLLNVAADYEGTSGLGEVTMTVGDESITESELGNLKGLAGKKIPTKTSDLTNDSGFITDYTEADPTVPSWAKASTKPKYTASEVGADASGTANSAVATHNTDTSAHADIRDAISQLSSEKVDKNQGSANVGKILVVGTDGNLTLADMPEGGAGGDVVGMIDENNNIIITGNLADGTYVFKYEGASGTYTDIGSLVVGGVVEYSITAILTECTAVSGNAVVIKEGGTVTLKYVANDGFVLNNTISVNGASYTWDETSGTLVLSNPTSDITITITATKNGYTNIIDTVGYTDGYRLSTSSGSLSQFEDYTSTGLITVPKGDTTPVTMRTKGVNFNKASQCAAVLYDASGTIKSSSVSLYNGNTSGWNNFTWSFDADGNMTMNYTGKNIMYIKICGYGSGANLIITINEEIN